MEIYENTVHTVYHHVYLGDDLVDADADVTYQVVHPDMPLEGGGFFTEGGPADRVEEGVYRVTLGESVTATKSTKLLHFLYEVDNNSIVTSPEQISVIRPYISLQEYNSRFVFRPLTMRDFRVVERTVRRVIDSYCRQNFQLRSGETKVTYGQSTNALQLPERLVTLTSVRSGSVGGAAIEASVVHDATSPWSIHTNTSTSLSPRQSDPFESTNYFVSQRYYITGDWGWEYVPQEVKDAAAILINDFLDDDAVYREKYIDNIRAADWRMEFAATGNETTGNANADMMLERFRAYRPEIV